MQIWIYKELYSLSPKHKITQDWLTYVFKISPRSTLIWSGYHLLGMSQIDRLKIV